MANHLKYNLTVINVILISVLFLTMQVSCHQGSFESFDDDNVDECQNICDDYDGYYCDAFIRVCEPCSAVNCVENPKNPSLCPQTCIEFLAKSSALSSTRTTARMSPWNPTSTKHIDNEEGLQSQMSFQDESFARTPPGISCVPNTTMIMVVIVPIVIFVVGVVCSLLVVAILLRRQARSPRKSNIADKAGKEAGCHKLADNRLYHPCPVTDNGHSFKSINAMLPV